MEVLVCKSCGQGMGEELIEALGDYVEATDCLSSCSKACTMMVRAPGKPCYVLGGLSIHQSRDIVHFLRLYRLSGTGNVGWSLRPPQGHNHYSARECG